MTFSIVLDGTGSLPVFMSYLGGVLTIAPSTNTQGGITYTIRVTVQDNNSVGDAAGVKIVTTTFDVTINKVNSAPVWSNTPAN